MNKRLFLIQTMLLLGVMIVNAQFKRVKLKQNTGILQNSTIYVVENTFPVIKNDSAAYTVAKGATTLLYFPPQNRKRNNEITVYGANADSLKNTPAFPAIRVPKGSTLIVSGSGKLKAVGGNGTAGEDGKEGYLGRFQSNSDSVYYGGNGGNGGIGVAPAIGGISGLGGAGAEKSSIGDQSGNAGQDGHNGEDMGTVILLGDVILDLSAGTIFDVTPKGGMYSEYKILLDKYVAPKYAYGLSPAGGGGAGANGNILASTISAGAPGAGGGASGSTGYAFGWQSFPIKVGVKGLGGQNFQGSAADGFHVDSSIRVDGYDCPVTVVETPAEGGKSGAKGDDGKVYVSSFIDKTVIGERDIVDVTDEIIPAIARSYITFGGDPNVLEYPDPIPFYSGKVWQSFSIPKARRKDHLASVFTGYVDKENYPVIDAEGKITDSQNKYFKVLEGGKVVTFINEDLHLLPVFNDVQIVPVRHIIGRPGHSGMSDEFQLSGEDHAESFLEAVWVTMAQNATTATVTFSPSGTNQNVPLYFLDHTMPLSNDTTLTISLNGDLPEIIFYHRYDRHNISWTLTDGDRTWKLGSDEHLPLSILNEDTYTKDTVQCHTMIEQPRFRSDRGYDIDYWIVNGDTVPYFSVSHVFSDYDFVAVLKKQEFNVSAANYNGADVHGTINIEGGKQRYFYGDTVSIKVTADPGYAVKCVTAHEYTSLNGRQEVSAGEVQLDYDKETGMATFVMPRFDVVLTAQYNAIPYQVTAVSTETIPAYSNMQDYVIFNLADTPDKTYTNKPYKAGSPSCPDQQARPLNNFFYTAGQRINFRVFALDDDVVDNFLLLIPTVCDSKGNELQLEGFTEICDDINNLKAYRTFSFIAPDDSVSVVLRQQTCRKTIVEFKDETAAANVHVGRFWRNGQELLGESYYKEVGAGQFATFTLEGNIQVGQVAATYIDEAGDTYNVNLHENTHRVAFRDVIYYTMVMPDYDVTIHCGDGSQKNIYALKKGEMSNYYCSFPPVAVAGSRVALSLWTPDGSAHPLGDVIVRISWNDGKDSQTITDFHNGICYFTMPDHDVRINISQKAKYLSKGLDK